MPEKTCWQTPQRTRPLRSFSWSGTTLKLVWHWGQVVASAIGRGAGQGYGRTRRSCLPGTTQASPAFVDLVHLDAAAWVACRDLVDLPLEQAGQQQGAAGPNQALEHRREQLERIGEDVGEHDVGRRRGGVPAAADLEHDPVGLRIRGRAGERLVVDVDRDDLARAEPGRRDREDARPAAVVDHAQAGRHRAFDPAQAHARRRMAAGAESEPRVQHDAARAVGLGDRMPARRNAQARTDLDRGELRLGLAYPIAFGDGPPLAALGHRLAGYG